MCSTLPHAPAPARTRTRTRPQVLTHVREKSHFLDSANAALRAEAASLAAELAARRDGLSEVKRRRDTMRATGAALRGACDRVTNPLLLADFQVGWAAPAVWLPAALAPRLLLLLPNPAAGFRRPCPT